MRVEHLEATNLLTRFVERSLAPDRRRQLEEHIAGCDECREWLATFHLLAQCDAGELDQVRPSHPSSLELATFAAGARGMDEAPRERCAAHLEDCAECRLEVELVGAALDAARRPEPATTNASMEPRRRTASPLRLAWAAGLLLALGALALLQSSRAPSTEQQQRAWQSPAAVEDPVATEETILLEQMTIATGAQVALTARAVALGNGFSVGSGADLSVLIELQKSS